MINIADLHIYVNMIYYVALIFILSNLIHKTCDLICEFGAEFFQLFQHSNLVYY